MELVAYGAQDVYLTGNPQITFFKVVYRRHTLLNGVYSADVVRDELTTGVSLLNVELSFQEMAI